MHACDFQRISLTSTRSVVPGAVPTGTSTTICRPSAVVTCESDGDKYGKYDKYDKYHKYGHLWGGRVR